jgi:glc operon protein GlcG
MEFSMETTPMRKPSLVVAALLAASCTNAAWAQSAFIERKQVSPATARKLVDACIARAEQQKEIVGCAVVDISGVLVDFHTMGGQATFAETAILKAKTAAHWQRATSALEEDVNSKRNGASVWIGDFPRAGGVPIMVDGQVAGAMGVGGGSEELAKFAIEAVLGKQQSAKR